MKVSDRYALALCVVNTCTVIVLTVVSSVLQWSIDDASSPSPFLPHDTIWLNKADTTIVRWNHRVIVIAHRRWKASSFIGKTAAISSSLLRTSLTVIKAKLLTRLNV